MTVSVKICGLTRAEDAVAAVTAGAQFVGMVFYRASPRFITPLQATTILEALPRRVRTVGLFADPDNTWLDQVVRDVRLDMIQLHGMESVAHVQRVRQNFGLPVIKAIALQTNADLAAVPDYLPVADWLLFDARPPQNADRPGGHGIAFDWNILQHMRWSVPWILAGGLTPTNVAEAIQRTGATVVDVSSGVEERIGVKSTKKILSFIAAVKTSDSTLHPRSPAHSCSCASSKSKEKE